MAVTKMALAPARSAMQGARTWATRSAVTRAALGVRHSSSGPTSVFDRSLWRNVIPKPLRRENRSKLNPAKRQDWNPATFFIVMFLFIGSMSIQMIALRNSFERYMRQSSVKIGALREVVEKIQRGEVVDVKKALGTGDPEQEADWEEILRAIERDETMRKPAKKSRSKRIIEATEEAQEQASEPSSSQLVESPDAARQPEKSKASFANFF